MKERQKILRKIYELDFAIHELVLFLDTHPKSGKALALLDEYRNMRKSVIRSYEDKFGPYMPTADDVPADSSWAWIKGPWPWENEFAEV